ncbi:MAG: hypothetical protein IT436_15985 [Phycisphaerales bacterium]|nr:hypothetical protein [Phycisphaerales bacterium]
MTKPPQPPNVSDSEFARLFEEFQRTAFRVETLPRYSIPEEREAFAAFLDGNQRPSIDHEWVLFVRDAVGRGKRVARVHVLPARLTPYLRFEIEWGYAFSAEAGEDVRLVLPSAPASVRNAAVGDFWVFDDRTVVLMEYTTRGEFRGARVVTEPTEVGRYCHARDVLLGSSLPFAEFLTRYRAGEFA